MTRVADITSDATTHVVKGRINNLSDFKNIVTIFLIMTSDSGSSFVRGSKLDISA